jgi:hypothetical protein
MKCLLLGLVFSTAVVRARKTVQAPPIDGLKPSALIDLVPEEKSPNRYTRFFEPKTPRATERPDTLQLRVRRPNSKNWTTLPYKTTVFLPAPQPSRTLGR